MALLTRKDILNQPEAPVGQRACDVPLSPKQGRAIESWLKPIQLRLKPAALRIKPIQHGLESIKLAQIKPFESRSITDLVAQRESPNIQGITSIGELIREAVRDVLDEHVQAHDGTRDGAKSKRPVRLKKRPTLSEIDAQAKEFIVKYGYPGSLRKLGEALLCSHEVLRDCPSVIPHIDRKKGPAPKADASAPVSQLPASNADPLDELIFGEDVEALRRTLSPDDRASFDGLTPDKQLGLIHAWQEQEAEKSEETRPKYGRRRTKI